MRPVVVVVGDVLLDVDLEGRIERMSPEAPVPVVDLTQRWERPGGAGLAAMLAARDASDVVLITALGGDPVSTRLLAMLRDFCRVVALPMHGRPSTKTRVGTADRPLLRLDEGDGRAADAPLPAAALRALRGADAIAVCDYGHGVTALPELRDALTAAARATPVVWDPHPRGTAPVPGVWCATPNIAEAASLLGDAAMPARQAARTLQRKWRAEAVAVTTGADGAVVYRRGDADALEVGPPPSLRPGPSARPDTCGAGDRFAVALAAALAERRGLRDAVAFAVESASRFVGAGGAVATSVTTTASVFTIPNRSTSPPARPRPSATGGVDALALAARVRADGGRVAATGGCFDLLHPGHSSLLRQARALGNVLIVCVNSDASVRSLKGPARPLVPERDRVRLLEDLGLVDAVLLFDSPTPEAVLESLRPDVWVKGADYADADLPESAVVRRHGGEIVFVPIVPGYSTTRIVEAARTRQ